jgi:hypothetical protein
MTQRRKGREEEEYKKRQLAVHAFFANIFALRSSRLCVKAFNKTLLSHD